MVEAGWASSGLPDLVLDLVLTLPVSSAFSAQYFPVSPVSSLPLTPVEPVAAEAYGWCITLVMFEGLVSYGRFGIMLISYFGKYVCTRNLIRLKY